VEDEPTRTSRVWTVPNLLSMVRLAGVPVFLWLVLGPEADAWALVLLMVSGVTDYLDGYLARRWHVESAFGKVADPLADRLMIDAAVVLLWIDGRLPWVALAVILARDAGLAFGYPLVRGRGYDFEVNALGKVATWLLYAALVGVVASDEGTTWPLVLFWTGLALAVVAAAQYLLKARREVRR